jgi:hypothetical protein
MSLVRFTDRELVAYATGQADRPSAASIEDALAADPALARRLATLLVRYRTAASEGPAQLGGREKAAWSGGAQRPAVALAASIALLVGIGGGYLAASRIEKPDVPVLTGLARGEFGDSLNRVASGETVALREGSLNLISTFRNAAGALCRSAALARPQGAMDLVACRGADGWTIAFAAAEPAEDDDAYVPAGDKDLVDDYVAGIKVGPELTGTAERSALDSPGP